MPNPGLWWVHSDRKGHCREAWWEPAVSYPRGIVSASNTLNFTLNKPDQLVQGDIDFPIGLSVGGGAREREILSVSSSSAFVSLYSSLRHLWSEDFDTTSALSHVVSILLDYTKLWSIHIPFITPAFLSLLVWKGFILFKQDGGFDAKHITRTQSNANWLRETITASRCYLILLTMHSSLVSTLLRTCAFPVYFKNKYTI